MVAEMQAYQEASMVNMVKRIPVVVVVVVQTLVGRGGNGGSGVIIIRYIVDSDGDGVSDEKEDDAGTDKNDPLSFETNTRQ